jgi:hypothetical protein
MFSLCNFDRRLDLYGKEFEKVKRGNLLNNNFSNEMAGWSTAISKNTSTTLCWMDKGPKEKDVEFCKEYHYGDDPVTDFPNVMAV